ncbi:hypothetical protein EYR27_10595 [Xanthomonas oryzae]|nr:hypothetical protein EYR27_10595 [Xanthomonas oryzae]
MAKGRATLRTNPIPRDGRTLTPTPAPRPQRGRSKARAPVARNPCLVAPRGEGRCGAAMLDRSSFLFFFPWQLRSSVASRYYCGRNCSV